MAKTFTQGFHKTDSLQNKENKEKVPKAQIIVRNQKKPKNNLCRISKFLHVLIFEFLSIKDIFKTSSVCKSLFRSSQDNGVWEIHFPNQRRLIEFSRKYSNLN